MGCRHGDGARPQTMAKPRPTPHPGPTTTAKRRPRWPFVIFTLIVICLTVWWAKSALIRAIVLPIASEATGCDVSASMASIAPSGEIVLRDLVIRAPGLKGPASEVLTADVARIALDWSVFPPKSARAVELRQARVRLSQAEDLSLNLAPILRAGSGSGSAGNTAPPDLRLVDAVLELGEHRGEQYAPMARFAVSGSVTAEDASRDVYKLVLTQSRGPNRPPGVPAVADHTTILGTIIRADASIHLDVLGLDLADLNPEPGASSFRGYWEQLAIEGVIPDASIDYSPEKGLAAVFTLDGVSMNIPVPARADPAFGTPDPSADQFDLLAMSNVAGSVTFDSTGLHADIEGSIEDLRVSVDLRTSGLSLDAPLTCTVKIPEFVLTNEPKLESFAPETARHIFQTFSGPTATLTGRLAIQRGHDPVHPRRWSYRGAFDLTHGTARYDGFPYPVSEIDATFLFDDAEFRIVRLTGTGPTGAKVLASGRIWPPGDSAAVDVTVTAADMPMDSYFRDSMPESYRGVFDFLFDAQAHTRLRENGLIAGEKAPDAPAFELGGLGTMDIRVFRPIGLHGEFHSDITLRLPKASFLPQAFEYPVIASNAVLRILGGTVTIEPMELVGLTGATGHLEGTVKYPLDSSELYTPDLRLSVDAVPIDNFLLHAIDQRVHTTPGTQPTSADPAELIRALKFRGDVRCEAHILNRSEKHVGVDAVVTLEDLAAEPGPGLTLTELAGSIDVSEFRVSATDLTAHLADAALAISLDAPIHDQIDAPSPPAPTKLTIRATGLDLAQPIELAAMAVVPDELAAQVKDLRRTYNPAGRVDTTLKVESSLGEPWTWEVVLLRAENLAVTLDFGRIALGETSGQAELDDRSIRFRSFSGPASLDGDHLGTLTVDGTLARDTSTEPSDFRLSLAGAQFQTPAVRRLITHRSPSMGKVIEEYNPTGQFSVSVHRAHDPPSEPTMDWSLAIDHLSLTREGTPIVFESVNGPIRGTDQTGQIGPLHASGDGWNLGIDGAWSTETGMSFDASIDLSVSKLSDSFMAGLPAPVTAVLRGLAMRSDGTLTLEGARLKVASTDRTTEPSVDFYGALLLDRVAISVGVPIENITGRADFTYADRPGARSDLRMVLDAGSASLSGVTLTGVRADFASDTETDAILLRYLDAGVHGGRLIGRGVVRPIETSASPAGGIAYEINTELQDADFDGVLRELRASAHPENALEIADRGKLDAKFSAAGLTTDKSSLHGRLTARIEGGDVLNLPGIVPLLKVWNLQLPAGERVDLAFADAFLDSNRLVFEELGLYSASIRIWGTGDIRWSDQEVALTFESEGRTEVPVLSELYRGLQGEIAKAEVTGKLSEPQLKYQSLSGTRRILGAIFGDPDSNGKGR